MLDQVGKISEQIINLLGLNLPIDTPIFLGQSNIDHMRNSHPAEYSKYGKKFPKYLTLRIIAE